MITFKKKLTVEAFPPDLDAEAKPAVSAPAAKPEGAAVWQVRQLDGNFELSYSDAGGRPSLRRLHAVELKVGPGKMLLGGIDEGLDAYRGFRVDRIRQLRDTGTGETVGRNILDWLLKRAERRERAERAAGRGRAAPSDRESAHAF